MIVYIWKNVLNCCIAVSFSYGWMALIGTDFDTYLEATRTPIIDIGKSILIAGLISGVFLTLFYLLATYIATRHETRAQRIKRLYNHRFVKNLKRDLL